MSLSDLFRRAPRRWSLPAVASPRARFHEVPASMRSDLGTELAAFVDRGEPGAPDSRVLGAIAAALGVETTDLIRWIPKAGTDPVADLRARLADEVHRIRFDGGIGATPDTFFFGVARAERIVRGDA